MGWFRAFGHWEQRREESVRFSLQFDTRSHYGQSCSPCRARDQISFMNLFNYLVTRPRSVDISGGHGLLSATLDGGVSPGNLFLVPLSKLMYRMWVWKRNCCIHYWKAASNSGETSGELRRKKNAQRNEQGKK